MRAGMRRLAGVLILILSCCFPDAVRAQVSCFMNEEKMATPPGTMYYIDSTEERNLLRYGIIQNSFHELDGPLSLSYQNKMLWLRVPLPKDSSISYLMIRNPHINYAGLWLIHQGRIVKTFSITGDHRPFRSRPLRHPDLVFPLSPALHDGELLILVDKRSEQLHVPLHFLDDEGLLRYTHSKTMLSGFILGLSLFLFLFNIFLFIQMREKIYVLYGLYVLMALFYMFSDYGYSMMYLFPNQEGLSDYSRPVALSLATPLYFLFCTGLLQLRQNFPRQFYWQKRALVLYGIVFLASIPFMTQGGWIRVGLQVLMQVLQIGFILWILGTAFASYKKRVSYAPYIIASSFVLISSGFAYSLFLSGNMIDTLFTRNLMNIGFSVEISILAFVLSLRFKNYKDESERLLRHTSEQQDRIFRSVTDYQERELQRLSSLLHDSIGARLSALRLHLESAKSGGNLEGAVQDLSDLADEVRSFSHDLSPALLQKHGLVKALQQQIDSINNSGKLHIQFEVLGDVPAPSFRYQLLVYNIIQELIQNIIKHAEATEGIVQLMLEAGLVSIFVEDNGRGCDLSKIKEGLGFTQIRQLVTFVGGRLDIRAAEGKGCQVSIEFTLLPDERNRTRTHS